MIIQSAITIFHVDRSLNRSLEICPESHVNMVDARLFHGCPLTLFVYFLFVHVNMVDARLFHGCPLTLFVYLTISSNEKYGQKRAESDPLTLLGSSKRQKQKPQT